MTNKYPLYRLFVALALPENARVELLAQNKFFPQFKFSENFHLTLRFIGKASEFEPYLQALGKIQAQSFALRLAGFGYFPNGILWAAPEPSQPLMALHAQIGKALAETGTEKAEHSYKPHITVCRLKSSISKPVKEQLARKQLDIPWNVGDFRLYNSILTPERAIHETLAIYPLQ